MCIRDSGGGGGGGSAPAPGPPMGPPGAAPADSGGDDEGAEDVEEAAEPEAVTEEQVRTIVRDANQELVEKLEESTEEIKTEVQNNTEYLRVEVAKEAKNLTEFIGKVEKNLTKRISVVDISVQESLLQQNQLSYLITEQAIIDLRERLPELLETSKKLQGLLPVKKDECNEIIQCDICVKNKKCGWCEQEKRCVQGDKIGPINEICPFYSFSDCQSPSCGQYNNCSTCLLSPRCGWCRDQQELIEGCIEADETYQGCPEFFHIKGDNTECLVPQQSISTPDQSNAFPNYVDARLERESQIESKTPVERNLFYQQVVISLQSKAMMMKDLYDTILSNFKKLQDLKYEYQVMQQEVDKRKADRNWEEEYDQKKEQKDNETNANATKGNDTAIGGGNPPVAGTPGQQPPPPPGQEQPPASPGQQPQEGQEQPQLPQQAEITKLSKEDYDELETKYIEEDQVLLEVKQFLEDYEQHQLELSSNQKTDEEEAEENSKNKFFMFVQKSSQGKQNSALCSLLEQVFQL
eukprot:TRINITY_DN2037_c0_g1_i3.p1 TRINITY_DN2037_c0_g1~~TRINITY_DN2037_c0_g1_i3.p1  ORF type:complete len:564 (-),score=108.23 TRINITY_DN2037_c0_g1_i3:157-1722(-)